MLPCFYVSPWQLLNVIRSEMLLCRVPTRNSAPIVLGIGILLGLVHGNDIKVLVSKPVHRSRHTNQSCARRSRNPVLLCLLRFKTRNTKFPLFYDCRTYENIFRLFDDSANKTMAFHLKVDCKELRLVFVYHELNTWGCIHQHNHLVIIIREFVWDNIFKSCL